MQNPPVEAKRLELLPDLRLLLDAGAQAHLDAVCRTAAALFGTPIALVTLLEPRPIALQSGAVPSLCSAALSGDEPAATSSESAHGATTIRLVGRAGVEAEAVARDGAICEHTIAGGAGAPLVLADLLQDARTSASPLVTGDPHARFYAGVPLIVCEVTVGTLCILDTVPRQDFGETQVRQLRDLGLVVEAHLRLHAASYASATEERRRTKARLAKREALCRSTTNARLLAETNADFGHWRVQPHAWTVAWSEGIARIFGRPMPEGGLLDLDTHLGFYHPDDRESVRQRIVNAVAEWTPGAGGYQGRARVVRPDGMIRHVAIQGMPESDDSRTVTAIYGVVLDMTDLVVSEQQARETGQILRTTIETMDQGLISYGPDLRVRVHNRRAREIIDLPEAVLHEGARIEDVHRFLAGRGEFVGDADHLGRLAATGDLNAVPSVFERVRPNGMVLEIRGTALPSGGFVHTFTDVTRRRAAEQAVQQSEARYRALADSLPQLACIISVETDETIYFNYRYADYLGPIGTSRAARRACFHPDDLRRIEKLWKGEGGRTARHESEVRLRRHDGTYRWHKLVMLPIRQENAQGGTVVGLLATALDIDEIVAARSELQHTTDLLRLAQEAAGAGLWEWEVATGTVRHSPESARMFHLPEALIAASGEVVEMTEAEWAARVRPDELPRIWEAVGKAIEARATYACEFRLAAFEGRERWIQALARVVLDEASGKPVRLVGLHFDITERKAAEEALRLSEERLSLALDSGSDGLWDWNIVTGAIAFSGHYFRTLGYALGEIASRIDCWSLLVHPEDAEHALHLMREHLKGRSSLYECEYRMRTKAGAYRWTLARGRIVARDESGRATRMVGTYIDVTSRKEAESQIAHMAMHDALTGLPNRALFRERLQREIARSGEASFAVLACDLDGFKAVNDTLGHPVGDALLRLLAERLASVIGADDTVARLGGDEFAIILSGAGRRQGSSPTAQRVIEVVSQPFELGDHVVTVGVSIGIAVGPGGTDADGLFRNADIALYRAKAAGRNTFRFYEPGMEAEVLARNLLEQDMRVAVQRGDFALHYQPIVNAKSGTVAGFEALMRWHHAARGAVSPAEFIPLAEETGLIVALGAWALREACREAARWPQDLRVAVNISAVQFARPGLEQSVVAALAASGLPAHRLELEITESVLLSDAESVIACLHRLRGLGVRIALDDFGTGYSSLSYLRRFPFDKIKIDRSFVREIADPDTAAIVRAIVGLGERLGATITAEGIETEDQRERARQEGCTDLQGYLLGRPLPASEVLDLVRTRASAAA